MVNVRYISEKIKEKLQEEMRKKLLEFSREFAEQHDFIEVVTLKMDVVSKVVLRRGTDLNEVIKKLESEGVVLNASDLELEPSPEFDFFWDQKGGAD